MNAKVKEVVDSAAAKLIEQMKIDREGEAKAVAAIGIASVSTKELNDTINSKLAGLNLRVCCVTTYGNLRGEVKIELCDKRDYICHDILYTFTYNAD